MNDTEFQKAYQEQNRRDQIAYSTLATVLSMILNLSCSLMDYFMYPGKWWLFFRARLVSVMLVALVWIWFRNFPGRNHYRVFGVVWYLSPLLMILWMIYAANDPFSPYYAGLNIILLAVGLLSPWTVRQNLVSAAFVLIMYAVVSMAMKTPLETKYLINNETFLVLTAAIVVSGTLANARQRYREFELRWELDKSRRVAEAANRKLVELDQVKSRFFANISHELRTPLTLLVAPLEKLLQRNSLSAESRELLLSMHANGMRLLKLINDLLDLVRLESGRIEVKRERLRLQEFIPGLVSSIRQAATEKGLTLEMAVDPSLDSVLADRDKLEKILLNLLFNALKFTPAGGRVELRASKNGDQVVLVVQDNGVGIAEQNLPHVFDRFWQADNSSKRKFQGLGIGTALVKELVEIQHGTVEVRSEVGQGTAFTVCLPYHPAGDAVSEPTRHVPPPETTASSDSGPGDTEWLAKLYRRAELFPAMSPAKSNGRVVTESRNAHLATILVADDEPDMLRFLLSELSSHYRVVQATDGQQAVDRAVQFVPDLILLDMMMPEKDGLQACREIRQRIPRRNIPIVLLTARADEDTKLAALNAGASDFMTKPFSTTELHVRVKNLVEAHQFELKLSDQNELLESTIEELKETETQLVQSEKVASLGRMSAGIIHEINNPLNFAATGLFTLRNKGKSLAPPERAEYEEILHDVEEGIGRVKNIVSELRMFTHPETDSRIAVDAAEVVEASLRFLKTEWKDKVKVHRQLTPNQTMLANRNNLILVVVNLLQNAFDALKDKTFADHEQPTIWIDGRVENGKSILSVRDNGPGIDPKHVDKIFDPFFTTKEVGKGMGLGLAICYRIVQGCEGRIAVDTRPGQYCEFRLEFPVKT